ncbi:MAG: cadherin-like domain-containing protein [Bacteroidetes bacterium]|nr:cadherin-like domain-containing protein [Bacteroidota bacterium]
MIKYLTSITLLIVFVFAGSVFAQSVISNLDGDSVGFTEGGGAVKIDNGADASISDVDVAGYDGGNLTVSVIGSTANDDISIVDGAGVTLSAGMTNGSTVTIAAVMIGSIGTTGQDGANLVINLNASATDAEISTLLQNINYFYDSNDPPGSRTVRVVVTNGGATPSDNNDVIVNITTVNDPPTLTATTSTPTFTEDGAAVSLYSATSISTVESGQTITELILTITNVNNGADEILSIDGSDVTLMNGNSLITVTNSMTVTVSVVAATATVTISKAGGISGAAIQTLVDGITYRNENDTPNTSNRVVTLTSVKDNGGTSDGGTDTSALNTASTITVVAANDAPVLDNTASPAFTDIFEDQENPTDGSTNNSLLVSDVIDIGGTYDNYYDAEGDLPGIAITDVNSGSIWYTLNGGTNWAELTGVISETSALVLFANARIYFKPNTNVSGIIGDAVVFKAWDRTSGDANGALTVNTTIGTSFSTATDNISINITDINDAPALTATANDPTFTEGDPAVDLFSGVTFSTVEAGQNVIELIFRLNNVSNSMDEILNIDGSDVGLGIGDSLTTTNNNIHVLVTNRDTSDTWTYVTLIDTISGGTGFSSAVVQDIIDNMTYKNTSTAIKTSDRKIVIYSVKDDGGRANGGADSTAFLDSTLVSIIGVNDAPVLDNGKAPEFNGVPEDIGDPVNGSTVYSTLVSEIINVGGGFGGGDIINNFSDNDNDSPGLAVTDVNVQGTLWYSLDNGTVWTELTGVVSETSALLLFADDITRLYYKPDNGISGFVEEAINFKGWDRTSGGSNGTISVNTILGSAFSTASDSVQITVADINYPPTLTATGDDPDFTEGGAAVDLFSTITVSTEEPGQNILEFTLTIQNVADGNSEYLSIDGNSFTLTNSNSLVTSGNGMTIEIVSSGSTATVKVSKVGGITAAVTQSIIDGITYQNTSNNPGSVERVITIVSLKDDGGSANGSDTGSPGITSIINVKPINEPPVISNLSGDNSFIIAGGSASNIDVVSSATVTNPDSPNSDGGSISIVQTSGTTNGSWKVDGVIVKSGSDSVIDSEESISVYGIIVGTVNNPDNGQAGNDLIITFDANSTLTRIGYLLNNLMYSVPAGVGDRNFTLTLDDGDGNLNGGNSADTALLTVTVTQNPPVISNLNGDSQNYIRGTALLLDKGSNATVSDQDSPTFNSGNLTVSISSGLQAAEDDLAINTSGSVTLSAGMINGSDVFIEAVLVGTITSDGKNGNDLVITFNANSTLARVNSLLRELSYKNTNSISPSLATRFIDFSICDASGVGSATSEISRVEVVLNSTPTTSGIANVEVDTGAENTVIDLTLSFDDADDGSAGLDYTIKNISNAGLFTSLFISGTTLVIDYGLSTNGLSDITIRATDTGGLFTETTFNVKVGSGISVPVINVNTGGSLSEGGILTLTTSLLSAHDANSDTSSLVYNVTQLPRHGFLIVSTSQLYKSSMETLSFSHTDLLEGNVQYIHDGSEAESDSIKFTISDAYGNTSTEKVFIITITGKNDAPTVSSLASINMFEDIPYSISVIDWYDQITDPDNADSTLSFSISCNNENIFFNSNDNKHYTITTLENYFGTALLHVIISDGELTCETDISLTIAAVNDIPEISGLPAELTIASGSTKSIELCSCISDVESPDSLLILSFEISPDSVYVNYKAKSGVLTLLPVDSFTGNVTLTITVTDEQGGTASGFIIITVTSNPTGMEKSDEIPTQITLYQNYPNPFNPSTIIRYGIPSSVGTGHALSATNVSLYIYDILGNLVAALQDGPQSPGYYDRTWNASNVSSGIYLCVLRADSYVESRKMILLK